MESSFFAMMARMKYIERWSLMRNSNKENISEHSMEVSMLSHGLAIIGNERCGKDYDVEKAALYGLYHDATEIITGDMPTPVKYFNEEIQHAYKQVESVASEKLLDMLPGYMRKYYEPLLFPAEVGQNELYKLIKAADKLSAFIKCIEEEKAGNHEFSTARQTTFDSLRKMNLPEVEIFIRDFLPAYSKTLDELSRN